MNLTWNPTRESTEEPGLKEYEVSFLQLVDKLTNGTKLQIDVTGNESNSCFARGFFMSLSLIQRRHANVDGTWSNRRRKCDRA